MNGSDVPNLYIKLEGDCVALPLTVLFTEIIFYGIIKKMF